MASLLGTEHRKQTKKKTRQGSGRGTKLGNAGSPKHYVKTTTSVFKKRRKCGPFNQCCVCVNIRA